MAFDLRSATTLALAAGLIAAAPAHAVTLQPLYNVTEVGTGQSFSCALQGSGAGGGVYCWGDNGTGNVGNASYLNAYTAERVYGLGSGVAHIGIGGAHACAVMTGGRVRCWGSGYGGDLGNGSTADRHTPVEVHNLTNAVQVVSGNVHSCALTNTGGVKCWGTNAVGQVGDSTFDDRWEPVDVVGLTSGVARITAGFQHTCALTTAGAVKCWGRNTYGEMGNNGQANTPQPTPANVLGLGSGIAAVDADGGDTTCALTTTGAVKCWGLNTNGDVGDGTMGHDRFAPVNVVGLASNVLSITARCAVLAPAHALRCWGTNNVGQVGDGTTTARPTPVDVINFGSDALIARALGGHRCGIRAQGHLQCWGSNYDGELGDATTISHVVAADVLHDGDPVFPSGGFDPPIVP
jgi:alpha-tubulin suppressor-like RCC1 family protein